MSQTLKDLRFEGDQAAYRQVTEQVRALILSGALPANERLPSGIELARDWGLNLRTIHQGMLPLVKEGLLARTPRRGTFVRQRQQKLTAVAVYYSGDIFGKDGSLYSQAVHAALQEELASLGIEMDVWVDPRPTASTGAPWPEFVKAAQERRFQAVIVTMGNRPLLQWMSKVPVPVAFQCSANIPNRVAPDMKQFVDLGLRALARQGCRSVGLITPLQPDAHDEKNFAPHASFFECFTDLSGDLGLTLTNRWMRLPPSETEVLGRSQETFGYEQFLELWRQETHPDGLVVWPDTAARGVIMAIREQQVRVPADLKLLLAKNETIDLLCPVPATLAVFNERAIARALIAQVQQQFRGETCEPVFPPFRLLDHDGRTQPFTTK